MGTILIQIPGLFAFRIIKIRINRIDSMLLYIFGFIAEKLQLIFYLWYTVKNVDGMQRVTCWYLHLLFL